MAKISIITVCFNAIASIERTLQSVAGQSFCNYEYIIIDGRSTDGSLDIIKNYHKYIRILISEPDKGLYDAMNKGLALATSEYVCFLNAGDTFYENTTLEKVFGQMEGLPDVVYGETMIVDNEGNEIGRRRLKTPQYLTWKSFKNGMVVCHQSVYVKRALAQPYNLNYQIVADFEWVLLALKNASSIYNSGIYLTRFLDGGINKKNIRRGLTERFRIMVAHYGLFSVVLQHLVIGVKFFWFWFRNKRF